MDKTLIVRYRDGRPYAVKVPQDLVEKFGLSNGVEIPLPLLLHLVYLGKAEVYDDRGSKLCFEDLVRLIKDSDTFSTFIVLHDLVKRGKKVYVGGSRELVLADENTKVYILDEDSYLLAEDLYKLVDRAIKQGYRFVIALVDINGEITYYEATETDFPKIERR